MERITTEQKEKAHSFVLDFYSLMKEFWEPDGSDDFWDELLQRCGSISEKFPDRRCSKILIGFVDALDEVAKSKGASNG